MSKELIEKLREDGKFLSGNFGKLMHEAADALEFKVAQYIAGVGRAIDDCARLPVVAWKVSLPTEPELGFWFSEEAEQEPRYQHHEPLCLLTDAQALLAELRAEVDKWKSLAQGANAISEICLSSRERADRLARKDARIAEQQGAAIELARLLNEACGEIRELKAKLQAAPAERGVVVLKIGNRLAELLDEDQWAEIEPLLARLNPAPATADSDTCEVCKGRGVRALDPEHGEYVTKPCAFCPDGADVDPECSDQLRAILGTADSDVRESME